MAITEHFPLSAADSDKVTSFRMVDVGDKAATRRRAVARGTLHLSADAYAALREKKNPKGDVLAQAEIAGIMAVKRVPETIPLCHSLPVEYARFRFEFSDNRHEVTAFCEVGTTAKTGVEMEALAGVNGALLSIYDLCKAVNPVLSITGIRLDLKEGGKSGAWFHPDFIQDRPETITSDDAPGGANRTTKLPTLLRYQAELQNIPSCVLVVSDRCARGEAQDDSGERLKGYLTGQGAKILKKSIVADEIDSIRREARELCAALGAKILFVTGGTGVAPRDVTPEAFEPLWTKPVPGIGELLRAKGAHFTPMSYISRGEGGFVGETFVVLMPGSEKAVEQALAAIDPVLSHLLHISRGGAHGYNESGENEQTLD